MVPARVARLTPDVLEAVLHHPPPAELGPAPRPVSREHVPEEIRESEHDEEHASMRGLAGVGLDRLEKEAIRQTLAMTNGNREQTSKLLGIGERTLYRKLKEYGLR
mgnify:CR=1 FL=1